MTVHPHFTSQKSPCPFLSPSLLHSPSSFSLIFFYSSILPELFFPFSFFPLSSFSYHSSFLLGVGDVLRHLDRGLLNRGRVRRHVNGGASRVPVVDQSTDDLGDGAPSEWALLLIGCLLGLATGICVATFNRGVYVIHEWAWACTPNEGATWLRLQRLAITWHRILLIPVTGEVVVGMMHGLLEIFEQIKQSRST